MYLAASTQAGYVYFFFFFQRRVDSAECGLFIRTFVFILCLFIARYLVVNKISTVGARKGVIHEMDYLQAQLHVCLRYLLDYLLF